MKSDVWCTTVANYADGLQEIEPVLNEKDINKILKSNYLTAGVPKL